LLEPLVLADPVVLGQRAASWENSTITSMSLDFSAFV
jgi:hypothetical protein